MLTTRASAAGFPALKSSIKRSDDTRENSLLSSPHRRFGARGTGRMVVPEDVQSAVHHQSQHFLTNGYLLSLRVVASDLRANVDVSDHCTTLSGPFKAKRDHVSRTMMAEVAAIQLR